MDMIQIARILKSNGTDGEVLMGFRGILPGDIDAEEPVFIRMDGLPVPFFMESFKVRGSDKALVHFYGVDSLEDAEEIAGKDVFADASEYEDEEEDDLSAIEGWTLLHEDGREAGIISGFEDIPGNPCLYVETPDGQAMIPFHEDLVLSVDSENRRISMTIPDGLL